MYLIYVGILMVLSGFTYKLIHDSNHERIIIKEANRIAEHNYLVEEIMTQIRSDVNFLATQSRLFFTHDKHEYKRHLKETYAQYSRSKRIYDQIRFIDTSGFETTRVNFDGHGSYIVPENMLQSKSNRYYFKEIMKLKEKEIYFSPFDLNIENGVIESPQKPMIRIGMPVFGTNSKKNGIVVVNYLGSNLLKKIKKLEFESTNKIILTNKDGFYLKGLSEEYEWGFMYKNKKHQTIFNDFKKAAKTIYSKNEACFYTEDGLFCFKTIYPTHSNNNNELLTLSDADERFWKLISYLPSEDIKNIIWEDYGTWLILYLSTLIPIAILLWFLAQNIELRRLANYKVSLKNRALEEKNDQIIANLNNLRILNLDLDKSNKKLEELVATKDKFFSIIAHDLKNPLSANLSLLSLLDKDFNKMKPQQKKEMIGLLVKSSHNIYNLLNNLLTWANSQRGTLKNEPSLFNINTLTNTNLEVHKESADNKQINIIFEDFGENTAYADRNMISTIIHNLISNAIKFTPIAGKIRIHIITFNKKVQFSIQDTGVGMNDDKIKKLFKIEHSFSTPGTEKEKGTGLGLLLCKEFIDTNNGDIWIESEENKGTTIFFTLPAEG